MISVLSFDALKKVIEQEYSFEDLKGLITKEKIDKIISSIKKNEFVDERFFLKVFHTKDGREDWHGLKIGWNNEERAGVLIVSYEGRKNWYNFNLGSFNLNRLYELVPDMDKSQEEVLKAEAKEESLEGLMKWKNKLC